MFNLKDAIEKIKNDTFQEKHYLELSNDGKLVILNIVLKLVSEEIENIKNKKHESKEQRSSSNANHAI